MNSNCIDLAKPGTGPIGFSHAPMPSLDFEKYNGSFNLSFRSKSDLNMNPQPEGVVKSAYSNSPQNREGYYVPETDRGELSPTAETQVNIVGGQQFQNRLQDDIKPTTKETLLFSYSGNIAPVSKNQALYSQFIPEYLNVNNTSVRVGGSSNYGLRTAAEYSYFNNPGPTTMNNSVMQNPDTIYSNLWKRPDFNVDGPGTFKDAIPDGSKFQNYRLIEKPTTNGLKLHRNLETESSELHSKSQLLGGPITGIENRFTASYQIEPLLTNPLHKIWNPDNKGELPTFFCNTSPEDYSYVNMKRIPESEYSKGGFNGTWVPDGSKDSANSYILGLSNGIHNERLEWTHDINNRPGVVYSSDKVLPGGCYSGNRSLNDLYTNDPSLISKAYPYYDNTFTTIGDPSAGIVK